MLAAAPSRAGSDAEDADEEADEEADAAAHAEAPTQEGGFGSPVALCADTAMA